MRKRKPKVWFPGAIKTIDDLKAYKGKIHFWCPGRGYVMQGEGILSLCTLEIHKFNDQPYGVAAYFNDTTEYVSSYISIHSEKTWNKNCIYVPWGDEHKEPIYTNYWLAYARALKKVHN